MGNQSDGIDQLMGGPLYGTVLCVRDVVNNTAVLDT